jgi:hypothetical protein
MNRSYEAVAGPITFFVEKIQKNVGYLCDVHQDELKLWSLGLPLSHVKCGQEQRQFVQQKVVQPDLVDFLVTYGGIVNTVCQFISTCRSVRVNTSLMSLCSRLVNIYVKCDSMVRMFQKCFKR